MTGDWKNPFIDSSMNGCNEVNFTRHSPLATRHCFLINPGLINYAEAYALQKRLVAARKADAIPDVLLLCEHPHVITLGRNGKQEHLLASEPVLQQKGVEFHSTDRGGDITYHGPGQIVGYPILNLGAIRRDVVWYVRMLEEVMLRATAEFGIAARRVTGKTGVWADRNPTEEGFVQKVQSQESAEKLAAIGIHISRWVTSHGFAYNVSTDLRFFDLIVPCGIAACKTTSLEKLLGRSVDRGDVTAKIVKHFGDVFGLEIEETSREMVTHKLEEFESIEQPAAAMV